jgi:hypothetical protein
VSVEGGPGRTGDGVDQLLQRLKGTGSSKEALKLSEELVQRLQEPRRLSRWLVRTLTDADASKVAISAPEVTTVAQLRQLPRPFPVNEDGPRDGRIAPVELTVFTVTAAPIAASMLVSGDVKLVIVDPTDPSATMIVRFPDPRLVQADNPALVEKLTLARNAAVQAVTEAFHGFPMTSRTKVIQMIGTARITGVGFFEMMHGQVGIAPNGLALTPVLEFALVQSPAG